jgi:hypothetical protein
MIVELRLEPSAPPLPVAVPLPSPPPLCCEPVLVVVFDTGGGTYVPPGAPAQTYCPVVFVQRPIRFGFQERNWVMVTVLLEAEMLCAN